MKVCPGCGSDTPTMVSLFDGIGGFPLAFTRAGYRVVALVEIDKAAAGVAADHFPEAKHFPDVTKVTADDLITAGFCPLCGIICAGFPCQDLSLAGRRAGLDGARSGLFFEIVRLARDLRCRWLVLENVPGLLSSVCPCPGGGACDGEWATVRIDDEDGFKVGEERRYIPCTAAHTVRGGACGPGRCVEIHGGAMGAVLGAVAELGYGFAYRVLDAQHFGVPQRRRRVFIVGCLRDGRAPAEVLLEPEGRERDSAQSGAPRSGTARGAADGPAGTRREVVAALGLSGIGGNGGPDDNAAQGGHLVAAMLTQRHGKGPGSDLPDGHDVPVSYDLAQITSSENRSNPQPDDPSRPVVVPGRPAVAGVPGVAYALRRDPGGTGQGHNTTYVPMAVGGEVTHALTAEGADASEDGTGRGTPVIAFGHTNGLDHQASETITPTLRAGRTSAAGQAAMSDSAVRRLTPTECERLQGYPDGWTALSYGKPQADSARYRQLGNSVAVPVVEWIARRMAKVDA